MVHFSGLLATYFLCDAFALHCLPNSERVDQMTQAGCGESASKRLVCNFPGDDHSQQLWAKFCFSEKFGTWNYIAVFCFDENQLQASTGGQQYFVEIADNSSINSHADRSITIEMTTVGQCASYSRAYCSHILSVDESFDTTQSNRTLHLSTVIYNYWCPLYPY